MKRMTCLVGCAALVTGLAVGALLAQSPTQGPQPFSVGNRLGLPITPAPDGAFNPISSNVKVYGAIYSAESCSYDATRGVIVVPNRGVPQNVQTNNAWVSFINHDGSVHTARWIGVQNPADRASLTPPLVLNEPYGSDIANGMLYVADRDGGTTPTDPSVAVVRRFNLKTGAPAGEFASRSRRGSTTSRSRTTGRSTRRRPAPAGRIPMRRAGRSGRSRPTARPRSSCRARRFVSPTASPSIRKGNIVVVNIGNRRVLTFSRDGKLLKTENAAQPGNDGLVIMPDGTKYVSSVQNGGVSRIRPGQPRRAHRAEHPQRGVDVLRRRREAVGDSDERQQRAGLHSDQVSIGLVAIAEKAVASNLEYRLSIERFSGFRPAVGTRPSPRRFEPAGRFRQRPDGSTSCPRSPGTAPVR